MKKFGILLFSLFIFACNSQPSTESEPSTMSKEKMLAHKKLKNIETLTNAPSGIELEGKQYITGRKWSDANGENLLLFSFTETPATDLEGKKGMTKQLFTQLMVKRVGIDTFELAQHLEAHENVCEFENKLILNESSISITDLDEDNINEATYVYTQGCVKENAASYPMRLRMLEYAVHYDMWGYVRYKDKMITEGSKQKPIPESDDKHFEASFDKTPESFQRFASQLWDVYELQ